MMPSLATTSMPRVLTDVDAILGQASAEGRRLSLYALADAAQDATLPMALKAYSRSLFGDGLLGTVSPHLVALPDDAGTLAWRWIGRHAPSNPCIVIFAADVAFDALFAHLRRFLDVRVTANKSMHLAFWDPAILGTLLGQPDDDTLHVKGPIFSDKQRSAFLEPIRHGWYWDRQQRLRHIEPASLDRAATPDAGEDDDEVTTPLMFTPQQVDQIVRAAVPDQVLYELQLNRPGVLDGRSTQANYALASRLVNAGYGLKIRGLRDLVNFVGTGMILGEGFYQHPTIAPHLQEVAAGRQRFTEALEHIPDDALEQAMQAGNSSDAVNEVETP